jgi:hypothetical protein
MNRSIRKAIGFFILAAALSSSAAQAQPAGVNARERNQRQRIHAGVQDGSLTRREACHLRHQQLRTEGLERRMRADGGGLGPRERLRLDHRLDFSSANIYHARHDAQGR